MDWSKHQPVIGFSNEKVLYHGLTNFKPLKRVKIDDDYWETTKNRPIHIFTDDEYTNSKLENENFDLVAFEMMFIDYDKQSKRGFWSRHGITKEKFRKIYLK
jgi:hypothetical protein